MGRLCYHTRMKDKEIQKLKERAEYLLNAIGYMEDRQGFAPKELISEYHAAMSELKKSEKKLVFSLAKI